MLDLRRYHILFLFLISLFVFLGYLNTFNGEFVFDDAISIQDNQKIGDFSYFKNLSFTAYLKDAGHGGRPFTNLTFAINYFIGGFDPFGYHVGNSLIHLANSLLVYILIYMTLRTLASPYKEDAHWISFLTTIFFALHPVQTGAVSYISQRAEILASFFYLLGLLLFIRGLSDVSVRSHIAFTAGIISLLLGIGSKEIIITLPFILGIYWVYFLRDLPNKRIQAAKIALLIFPTLSAAAYIVNSIKNDTGGRLGFGLEFSSYDYLLTQFRVITKYISLLFLPIGQNADYDFAVSRGFLNPPSTLLSFIFLFLLGCLIIFLYRRWKIGSFALLWFFVILSPTSSVIPIIDVAFEHRLYLASLGFFLLFSLGLYHASRIFDVHQKIRVYGILFTVLILILSMTYFTTKRNMVWTNKISFWEDVVHKSPLKARAYVSLGSAYQENGLKDFAVAAYSKATSLADSKEKPNSMLALALLYAEMGRTKEAISEMERAKDLGPIDSPDLHYVIGTVYAIAGRHEEAIKSYREALKRNPQFLLARYEIGHLYSNRRLYDDALMEYQEIIKMAPSSAKAYNEIGVIYAKKGMLDEARKNFLSALKLNPTFGPSMRNLQVVYGLKKND